MSPIPCIGYLRLERGREVLKDHTVHQGQSWTHTQERKGGPERVTEWDCMNRLSGTAWRSWRPRHVISAWWNSHIVTGNNQYTKEQVVTSTVEVLVTGEGTLDAVAREGLWEQATEAEPSGVTRRRVKEAWRGESLARVIVTRPERAWWLEEGMEPAVAFRGTRRGRGQEFGVYSQCGGEVWGVLAWRVVPGCCVGFTSWGRDWGKPLGKPAPEISGRVRNEVETSGGIQDLLRGAWTCWQTLGGKMSTAVKILR